jgi:hypothetical protein
MRHPPSPLLLSARRRRRRRIPYGSRDSAAPATETQPGDGSYDTPARSEDCALLQPLPEGSDHRGSE